MSWLFNLNIIRLFDFYLALMFLASTALRLRRYLTIIALVRHAPGRWPRLLELLKKKHGIFLTWQTILPALITLSLVLANTLALRLVWPQAHVSAHTLTEHWGAAVVILLVGLFMMCFDFYTLFRVSEIDRVAIEKHLDQAEYWLKSWAAPVVRVLTFGWINPRKIVDGEVHKALVELNGMLHSTLWWISLQTTLRIVFGLSVWLMYAWMSLAGTAGAE